MSKKHFIALADTLRDLKRYAPSIVEPDHSEFDKGFVAGTQAQLNITIDRLAAFCKAQNANFDQRRWMSYVAGECGPNGGKK